jgi:hypothetical protein
MAQTGQAYAKRPGHPNLIYTPFPEHVLQGMFFDFWNMQHLNHLRIA